MRPIYIILIAVQLVFIFLMILKMIRSDTIYDKMNGLSVIGADVIITVLIFGFLDGRPEMYIDIAIAYALMGFVTNIIVGKYLGGKKNDRDNS